MFFWYLVSVAASYGTFYLQGRAYSDYLKRNNYVSNTSPMGEYELKFDMFSLALKAFTPGFNIYAAVKILWDGSKDFEKKAADSLSKGKIRKLTKEEIEAKQKEVENMISKNVNDYQNNMNHDNNNNVYQDNNDYADDMNSEVDYDFDENNNFEDNINLKNGNTTNEEYDFNVDDNVINLEGMSLDEKIAYLEREKELLISIKKDINEEPKQYRLGQK